MMKIFRRKKSNKTQSNGSIMLGLESFSWAACLKEAEKYNKKEKNQIKRHEWVKGGRAPGWLGETFGDSRVTCRRCGMKITYAAIDHNIFLHINENDPCPHVPWNKQ